MPLPDLIEIIPFAAPVRAEITVPGSKSITNRALILAALAKGAVTLSGALWSEDTQVMVQALKVLGFDVRVEADADEFCNRTITVSGLGGSIPNAGTPEEPLELFVGNAGTAARFLSVLVCLGKGVYRLSGVARMHQRPQAALFQALRELGYRVESENGNDKLPVRIFGCSSRGDEALVENAIPGQSLLTSAATKQCTVSIAESSQFASALLLCAKTGGWKVEVVGENADESPYVAMTSKLIEVFPKKGGTFQIEPDASSGSYFWGAGWLAPLPALKMDGNPETRDLPTGSSVFKTYVTADFVGVTVSSWPQTDWQIDARFKKLLVQRKPLKAEGNRLNMVRLPLPAMLSRQTELGDSIMTAIVLAPFSSTSARFTDLGRLRVQECERVVALRTELTKCGAEVSEEGDTLTVWPSPLHGAEIETYDDHRMAMCFAILGLKVPGIKIQNPACVKKTFPNFFQKLAAPPPAGLGAEIRDGRTGRRLEAAELFAD